MYGCGGVCKRFNESICMGACSMDASARDEFVKIQEIKEKAQGVRMSAHGALGTGNVLKPINPNAYAIFDLPKKQPPKKIEVVVEPLNKNDAEGFRNFQL
jgi:hypothetical protein